MFEDSAAVKVRFGKENAKRIAAVARRMAEVLHNGGKVLFCGNGGSAADAQHLAAEFVNRFQRDRRALAAIALTTDTSVLTSIGNDIGFERIFSRQVEALARPGDLLVAISTSGNSPNVLRAVEAARPASRGLLEVVNVTSWGRQRFARSSYHFWATGQVARLGPAMSRPWGGVHWIGEHTAELQQGIEGAMESAEREVGAVLARLGRG